MRLSYRPEIDGLRAIAVIAVILYHAGFPYAAGGFVGVDVFFVISGFLITSIVVQDLREDSFSIRKFYERRVRRIIPALFCVSALCLVPAWLWMFPDEFTAFGKSLVGVATFSGNIVFWLQTNYFSPHVERLPLLHIWSLGVEEQYYLLAPLAIRWLWVHGNRKRLIVPIGLVGIASLGLAEWGSRSYPSATFYLLHTRVWELMIGSGLAVSSQDTAPASDPWKANSLSLFGLLAILYSILAFNDKTTRFPSVIALIPTLGTMLVIRYADRSSSIGRVLSVKPLVGIGLISYSLYLWHQPVFAFARIAGGHELTASSAFILIVLALLLAIVTWRYVEMPFRRKGVSSGNLSSGNVVWIGALASMSALLVTGVVFSNKQVAQRHFTMKQQEALAWLKYKDQFDLYRQESCHLGPGQTFKDFKESCVSSGTSKSGAIVVWGDSFAAAMHLGVFGFSADRVHAQFTTSACPPLIGFTTGPRPHCADINRDVLTKIRELPRANVFLHANWSVYAALPGFLPSLSTTLKSLKEIGANPIVLGHTPLWYPSLPEVLAERYSKDGLLPLSVVTNQTKPLGDIDDRLAKIAEEEGVPFVRILPLLCDSEGCSAYALTNGKATPLVWDSGHLTMEGSEMVGRLIYPLIKDSLRQ